MLVVFKMEPRKLCLLLTGEESTLVSIFSPLRGAHLDLCTRIYFSLYTPEKPIKACDAKIMSSTIPSRTSRKYEF